MAGPGDPNHFDDHDDDLIGFASPASLQGRAWEAARPEPEPEPEPDLEPEPEMAINLEPEPQIAFKADDVEPEPDLFAAQPEPAIAASVDSEPAIPSELEPSLPDSPSIDEALTTPVVAQAIPGSPVVPVEPVSRPMETRDTFAPWQAFTTRTRRQGRIAPIPGGGMSLFAVYALILFAVPTLGVSVVIGLLAVSRRDAPDDTLSRSHFVFQKRTLRAAALVAAAGLVLLAAPLALGVPILFGLALWLVARGAAGVWALKAGRPITDPRGWWI